MNAPSVWISMAIVFLVLSCQKPSQQKAGLSPQESRAAGVKSAVLQSLEYAFAHYGPENFGTTKILVEANDFVPPNLSRIGKWDAEIITAAQYKERFMGAAAPAVAVIHVDTNENGRDVICSVSVSVMSLPLENDVRWIQPYGGNFRYKISNGMAILLDSNCSSY